MLGIGLTLILSSLLGWNLIQDHEIKILKDRCEKLEDKIKQLGLREDLTNMRILNMQDIYSAIDYRLTVREFKNTCKEFHKQCEEVNK